MAISVDQITDNERQRQRKIQRQWKIQRQRKIQKHRDTDTDTDTENIETETGEKTENRYKQTQKRHKHGDKIETEKRRKQNLRRTKRLYLPKLQLVERSDYQHPHNHLKLLKKEIIFKYFTIWYTTICIHGMTVLYDRDSSEKEGKNWYLTKKCLNFGPRIQEIWCNWTF